MPKDKFSPAPWTVEVTDGDMRILDSEGGEVCFEEEWDDEFESEQTANFLLMSEAPTLLKALEGLVGEAALELGDEHPRVKVARQAILSARVGL